MSVNGTLVEAKMCTFTLESTHFIFNKCPIYTHNGANAKFSTNSHETEYSVGCQPGQVPTGSAVYSVYMINGRNAVGSTYTYVPSGKLCALSYDK